MALLALGFERYATAVVPTPLIMNMVLCLLLTVIETVRDRDLVRVIELGRQWQHVLRDRRSVHIGGGAFSNIWGGVVLVLRVVSMILLFVSLADVTDTIVTTLLILAVIDCGLAVLGCGARLGAVHTEAEDSYLNAAASATYPMFKTAPGQFTRPFTEFTFSPLPDAATSSDRITIETVGSVLI